MSSLERFNNHLSCFSHVQALSFLYNNWQDEHSWGISDLIYIYYR